MRTLLLLSPLLLLLPACSPTITHSDSADWLVSNGTAYDTATIPLAPGQKLVLPQSATLLRNAPPGQLQIYLRKTLNFYGHGVPMSIDIQRNRMGCATKTQASTLTLATFGEWDTHMEGGSFIHLIISIPPEVSVETQPTLSGDRSLSEDHAHQPFYWIPGPLQPGWEKVPDHPDPDFATRHFPVEEANPPTPQRLERP